MTPLLLLALLAATYTFLGTIVYQLATTDGYTATYTFNEFCWIVQGLLTLPWHIFMAALSLAYEASHSALCEASRLLRYCGHGKDVEEVVGQVVIIVAAVGAGLWVSTKVSVSIDTISIPVPHIGFAYLEK